MSRPAENVTYNRPYQGPQDVTIVSAPCKNQTNYAPGPAFGQTWRVVSVRPANVSRRPYTSRWKSPTAWSREYFSGASPCAHKYTSSVYPCTQPLDNGTTKSWIGVNWQYCSKPGRAYTSSLLSRNTNDLLAKLKDSESVNLSLAFAERKQTEKLLINTLDRIGSGVRAFKAARKGDFAAVKRAFAGREAIARSGRPMTARERSLLRIPDAWLEMQYGWNPLMSDVYGAMHAVDKAQQDRDYILKCSKESKTSDRVVYVVNSNVSSGVRGEAYGNLLEICKTVVYYKLQSQNLETLASLGLTNPINLAWELVPFSFVVDWFLPIGNWFNTFDATLGKTFHSGTRTQVYNYPRSKMHLVIQVPDFYSSPTNVSPHVEWFRMNRSVLSSFPSPQPPAFKNPCSPSHVASALSLMASAFGRSVRPYVR